MSGNAATSHHNCGNVAALTEDIDMDPVMICAFAMYVAWRESLALWGIR